MVVMRTLGRGDWVALSLATVAESYTEGPDGAAVGGESCHTQYFITAKTGQRDDACVKMMTLLNRFLSKYNMTYCEGIKIYPIFHIKFIK